MGFYFQNQKSVRGLIYDPMKCINVTKCNENNVIKTTLVTLVTLVTPYFKNFFKKLFPVENTIYTSLS